MPRKNPWLVFLLPFLVFMLVGLEPTPTVPGGKSIGLAIPYDQYPLIYTIKIASRCGHRLRAPRLQAIPLWNDSAFNRGRRGRHLHLGRPVPLGPGARLHSTCAQPLGLGSIIGSGQRAAFNPFVEFANRPVQAWIFLAIRFFGLVLVVPLIEEFFLRGFVMRLAVEQDWWKVPFGKVNRPAVVLGTLVPMLMHPGELLAAAAWFSLITWLMLRTRNIWDCVAAHAVTNLLLGIYVVHREIGG